MRIVNDRYQQKIPIKLWLDDIEEGALKQAKNLANLPFAFKHVAIMPDSHQGYGMPIGGVLATSGIVIPNAVGVDIGCGMMAVKTSLTELDKGVLKEIMSQIRSTVPVGFNHHKIEHRKWMPQPINNFDRHLQLPIVDSEFKSACKQVGTLGGGNHFIEIQEGSDGHIWLMIHSGSRNLGYKVARHYNQIAKEENNLWYGSVDPKVDLAYLPIQSKFGELYLDEMNYCLEFAQANRVAMMNAVTKAVSSKVDSVLFSPPINIHHNYATMENHFGRNVMVHRKGATSARKGQYGIIPGSQGTKSYIVIGKGNPESFMSCSHGAGRTMSRKKAKETLNLEEEIKKMNDKGIIHSIRGKNSLDEASGAYKDIDVVMRNQKDLVDIVVELSPLGVIKG